MSRLTSDKIIVFRNRINGEARPARVQSTGANGALHRNWYVGFFFGMELGWFLLSSLLVEKDYSVSGCTIFNGPVGRDGSPFVRALFTHRAVRGLICRTVRTPISNFIRAMVSFFTRRKGNYGIAIPFGRRTFHFTSRLARETALTNTIGALGGLSSNVVLKSGASNRKLIRSLLRCRILLGSGHVLLLNTNKTTQNIVLPLLGRGPTSVAIIGHACRGTRRLTRLFSPCNRVRTVVVDRIGHSFSVIVGSASTDLSNRLPLVGSDVFSGGAVDCSVVCNSKEAIFDR